MKICSIFLMTNCVEPVFSSTEPSCNNARKIYSQKSGFASIGDCKDPNNFECYVEEGENFIDFRGIGYLDSYSFELHFIKNAAHEGDYERDWGLTWTQTENPFSLNKTSDGQQKVPTLTNLLVYLDGVPNFADRPYPFQGLFVYPGSYALLQGSGIGNGGNGWYEIGQYVNTQPLVAAGYHSDVANEIELFICSPETICSSHDQMEYWIEVNFHGSDLQSITVDALTNCMDLCLERTDCMAFTFDELDRYDDNCWLKSQPGTSDDIDYDGLVSGMRCGYEHDLKPTGTPVGKYPETVAEPTCPNCWTALEDGKCVPSEDAISLTCNSNSMNIKLDKCLTDNTKVTFSDSTCVSTDDENHFYLTSSLDSCGTFIEADEKKLKFSNYVIFEDLTSESSDDVTIYFGQEDADKNSNLANVKISCSYDKTVEISTEYDISNTSEGNETSTTEGQGAFDFKLSQTVSLGSNETIPENTVVKTGDMLYFNLNLDQSIAGVLFSIDECTVRDKNLNREYAVIKNKCSDEFLNGEITSMSSGEAIGFSYMGFQFTNIAGLQSKLELSCTAVACDESDLDSLCMVEPTC